MLAEEGLEISASSPEYGEAKEASKRNSRAIPSPSVSTHSIFSIFSPPPPTARSAFELKDEQSAGQLRPLGDETTRYRYVVMPMRI